MAIGHSQAQTSAPLDYCSDRTCSCDAILTSLMSRDFVYIMPDKKSFKSLQLLLRREDISAEDISDQWSDERNSPFLVAFNCGLTCETRAEDLLSVFGLAGVGVERLIQVPHKSFALIHMSSARDATQALATLNRHFCPLLGRKLTLAPVSPRVWDQLMAKNCPLVAECLSRFSRPNPEGLSLEEEFLSAEEEQRILDLVSGLFAEDARLKNRSVKHFGFRFDYDRNRVAEEAVDPIPEELVLVARRLLERHLVSELPDQLTLNRYLPGQGIPSHVDSHSTCGPFVACLSLGSDVVMSLKNPLTKDCKNLLLRRRSLLLLQSESRYLWTHAIPAAKTDVIPRVSSSSDLSLNVRECRLSLTFRKRRGGDCDCAFPQLCDVISSLSLCHTITVLSLGKRAWPTRVNRWKAWPTVSWRRSSCMTCTTRSRPTFRAPVTVVGPKSSTSWVRFPSDLWFWTWAAVTASTWVDAKTSSLLAAIAHNRCSTSVVSARPKCFGATAHLCQWSPVSTQSYVWPFCITWRPNSEDCALSTNWCASCAPAERLWSLSGPSNRRSATDRQTRTWRRASRRLRSASSWDYRCTRTERNSGPKKCSCRSRVDVRNASASTTCSVSTSSRPCCWACPECVCWTCATTPAIGRQYCRKWYKCLINWLRYLTYQIGVHYLGITWACFSQVGSF